MSTHENEFELRLGKTRREASPQLPRLRGAVRRAAYSKSASGPRPNQAGIRAHFAKGTSARPRPTIASKRQVVVKVRYASNTGGKGAPLRAHVAYLARELRGKDHAQEMPSEAASEIGRSINYLSREGEAGEGKFQFYDGGNSNIDARAVTAAWADDARHFRMIVSAEDGEELGDLRPFIRELMAGLEARLGTPLEWVAVDHHDTDNPHTHVLIRGKSRGQDLFIPSRLISSGIREQAQDLVTRTLGVRRDVDLARERATEIGLRMPTSLDRQLMASVRDGRVWAKRAELIGRLEQLEMWDLAHRDHGAWRLAPSLTTRLKSLAEADNVDRMTASYRKGRAPMPVLQADHGIAITGELVQVSIADDFGDRFLAIIETGQGELRFARFENASDLAVLADIQKGSVVTFEPNVAEVRPSDHAVARIADQTGGLYAPQLHANLENDVPAGVMTANVRRLEAMRRMGLVTRRASGEFEVGHAHVSTAMAFEQRLVERSPISAKVRSYWSLGEQIDAQGLTHLDRILTGEAMPPIGDGHVAKKFDEALQQRRMFLIEQGWMGEHQQRPTREALQKMAAIELSAKAKDLSHELGLHVLTHIPTRVAGVYARRIDLAQGRMALILGDQQGVIVPWRPALERFAGRQVEGVLRSQTLSWRLERGMGIGMPPR